MAGFGSIRTRLIALLIAASIPLFGMAGVIAWQNYRAEQDEFIQRTRVILNAAASRHDATVEGTELLLAAVGQAPFFQNMATPWDGAAGCTDYLRRFVVQKPNRYLNIAILDAHGTLLCSAAPPNLLGGLAAQAKDGGNVGRQDESFSETKWFDRVARTHAFTVMPPDYAPVTHLARIVAAAPILAANGALEGVVYSALRLDLLLARAGGASVPSSLVYHLWLIDDAGTPMEISQSPVQALPAIGDLPSFINHLHQARTLKAVNGDIYCYAVGQIGAGLRLLVGYDATADLALARQRLITRIVGLALLLLLGIGAIAAGANHAVRVPLARLTDAVRRWRGGGPFETPGARLPGELLELAAAFSQTTAALATQEMQLRGALVQQEMLVQEIHHRVKNNMQIVASLLNLQAARIRQPEAKAEFQSARDRVRALSTLHRHLYTHGELHTINMRSFLNELCAQLFHAFGETAGSRIVLTIEAPELRISSDQAVPLALIVTEAVSNAIKYAFPSERTGTISVRLTTDGSFAKMTIADDGIGLSGAEPAPTGGMGLQLIRGFSRQIGAMLTVETIGGMRYIIDMPLQAMRTNAELPAPVEFYSAA